MLEHSRMEKAELMFNEEGGNKGKQIDEFIKELSSIMSEVGDGDTVMLIHPHIELHRALFKWWHH
jgi:hypothetical protein